MDKSKIVEYWKEYSGRDMAVAEDLFNSKKYSYSLFFCHLSLEKLLKSFIVEYTGAPAPLGHGLVKLAELAGFRLTDREIDLLSEITTFNLKSRYDDYKLNFYKKATRGYATRYFKITKDLIIWLKKNYQPK